jgi:hypothetical protein
MDGGLVMPYTAKAHRFFELCAHAEGRAKAWRDCPSQGDAKKMASEGIKGDKAKASAPKRIKKGK